MAHQQAAIYRGNARYNIVCVNSLSRGGCNQCTGLTLWKCTELTLWANCFERAVLDGWAARQDDNPAAKCWQQRSWRLAQTLLDLRSVNILELDNISVSSIPACHPASATRSQQFASYRLFFGRALQPLVHMRFIRVLDLYIFYR